MLLISFRSSSVSFITINFNLIGRAWPPLLQAPHTLIKIQKERLKSNSTKILLIRPNIGVQQVILQHSSKVPFTATFKLLLLGLSRTNTSAGSQEDQKIQAEEEIRAFLAKSSKQGAPSRWNCIANPRCLVQGRGGGNILPREWVSAELLAPVCQILLGTGWTPVGWRVQLCWLLSGFVHFAPAVIPSSHGRCHNLLSLRWLKQGMDQRNDHTHLIGKGFCCLGLYSRPQLYFRCILLFGNHCCKPLFLLVLSLN